MTKRMSEFDKAWNFAIGTLIVGGFLVGAAVVGLLWWLS